MNNLNTQAKLEIITQNMYSIESKCSPLRVEIDRGR